MYPSAIIYHGARSIEWRLYVACLKLNVPPSIERALVRAIDRVYWAAIDFLTPVEDAVLHRVLALRKSARSRRYSIEAAVAHCLLEATETVRAILFARMMDAIAQNCAMYVPSSSYVEEEEELVEG